MESLHDLNREWASMLLIHLVDLIRKRKDLDIITRALIYNYERYKETVARQYLKYPFSIGVFYMNMLSNINIVDERVDTVRSSDKVELLSAFYQIDDQNCFTILLTDANDAEVASWNIQIDGQEISIDRAL